MRIKKAHLYVEKYSRRNQEMLLDFVREDEFLCFRYNGDYVSSMKLPEREYKPTMLLLYNCTPEQMIHEGNIITVDMDKLLMLRREGKESFDGQNPDLPATVCFEVQYSAPFAELFDDVSSSVSTHVSKEFVTHLKTSDRTSTCTLCMLNNLDDSFELRVWNVGQGSTCSICDGRNLTLFDFGASMYCTKMQLNNIIDRHAKILNSGSNISLIISHWDVDHYNLLCAADDGFWNQLCCVFYPLDIVGLTAMQIWNQIKRRPCQVPIPPSSSVFPHKCGIKTFQKGDKYTLFTGEKSADKNKSGLLLEVHSKTAIAFLTADHTNYQVWDKMYNLVGVGSRTLHVVVPHHGGNCGKTAVRAGTSSGIAAISVGSNNYGHPLQSTINAYRNIHYHVQRTDRCSDIVISMN